MDEDEIQSLSPPPIYDKMFNEDGVLTQSWQDWYSQVQILMNEVIDKVNTL